MHAAGVAQAWLSRDLGRTIKIANAYAKALRDKGVPASDVRADPRLDAILAQFEARRGADGPPKAPGMPAIETGQPEPSSERPAAQAEPGEFQGSS